MSPPISGQVQAIIERQTKFGPMYDLQVNGKKYGHGKFAPRGIQQGDFVTFEVDVKQNGQYTNYNVRSGTLRKDEGGTSASPQQTSAPSNTAKPAFNGGGFDARQETISKQAALNTALSFANLANAAGAIPHLAKAKEADKMGLLQAVVLEYAGMFYNLSTGNTWDLPEAATPTVAKPAAKPKAKVDDSSPLGAEEDSGYNEY